MRTARLTRRQAAGNRVSAGQAPVAAAIVRGDASRPVTGRTRHPLPPAPIAAVRDACAVRVVLSYGGTDQVVLRSAFSLVAARAVRAASRHGAPPVVLGGWLLVLAGWALPGGREMARTAWRSGRRSQLTWQLLCLLLLTALPRRSREDAFYDHVTFGDVVHRGDLQTGAGGGG